MEYICECILKDSYIRQIMDSFTKSQNAKRNIWKNDKTKLDY